MRIADPRDVLIAPVVSEKSYGLLDENKYTFLVRPDANKTQIKIAVEQVFGVTVVRVNTNNRQGKRVRTRAGCNQRPATKRAIVSLASGDRIDIFGDRSPDRDQHDELGLSRRRNPQGTNRLRQAVAARAWPTSSRSPARRLRSHWSSRCRSQVGATTRVGSRRVITVAATSAPTA